MIVLSSAFYFRICFDVYQAEKEREHHIREEISAGSKKIELSHLPHEEWAWRATIAGDNGTWERRFKLFTGSLMMLM